MKSSLGNENRHILEERGQAQQAEDNEEDLYSSVISTIPALVITLLGTDEITPKEPTKQVGFVNAKKNRQNQGKLDDGSPRKSLEKPPQQNNNKKGGNDMKKSQSEPVNQKVNLDPSPHKRNKSYLH